MSRIFQCLVTFTAGILLLAGASFYIDASGQTPWRSVMRETGPEFFKTAEARRVGDQLLLWQRNTGGWPKNIDMASPMSDSLVAAVLRDKTRRDDSTIDNDATSMQMYFLARLYKATGDDKYRQAFGRGISYLLSGQYKNGGWPQFWPVMTSYQPNITFNDNAIANTLGLFAQVRDRKDPFGGNLVDAALRRKISRSYDKGVECILNTQIMVHGVPTVWCQQYDRETLRPAPARAFELASFCSQESVGLVKILMSLPNPDSRVKAAVNGAMKWFDTYKLTGLKVVRTGGNGEMRDTRLVESPGAAPIWARFYDLQRNEPFVCDRDGIPRRHLDEIGMERRSGYSWSGGAPAELYPLYGKWADRYDPAHKLTISLNTPGANENGTIEMFRKPVIDRSLFDAVVSPGESIQSAIEKAPMNGTKPFKIFILNGIYNQKVVVDRPFIVLVGESKDSTRLIYAESAGNHDSRQYRGRPAGNGVISIWKEGNDCIISGMTVYNNYGTTVEKTTSHQFAVYGQADRTIIINCNVWSDGNDTIALWAPDGNGMYYHADLFVRCPGVDFLCPRGWCYATRCRFLGGTPADAPANIRHAMIWHDGRGDRSKKLVITNSIFDAANPTLLGRYHHDSQFFFVNCYMTSNIKDEDVSYAYTDKVLDPCPWGHRVYYLSCIRQGGQSGWMNDNVDKAGEPNLTYYTMLPQWVFNGKWDPESEIRSLWNVLAY